MIGHTVGSYKITEKIGEGGMGAVFKGIDVMLDREVAIKMLRPELARQNQIVERFRSEAITLAKLNHPSVATLYSFLRQGDDFFMVMEYVHGDTLEQVISKQGALPCATAVTLFCHALEGIEHAHGLGVIHRDIKPANLMLTERGGIKVMDFGIARVLGTDRMTKAGHLVGTIEYMSPEQIRGQETDARSDIYSLGILLYEMVTGRVPFTSPSEYELMRSQIEDVPPRPKDFAPQTPIEVEAAIMRALAKKKEERFSTAAEFRLALLTSQASQSQAGPSPISPGPANYSQQIKETRLGVPAATASQIKGTRLAPYDSQYSSNAAPPPGFNASVAGSSYDQSAVQPSFLERLNWKHYAAGGLALFVFVAVLVGAPLGFILSRPGTIQSPDREDVKPTPAATRPTPVPTTTPVYSVPSAPLTYQPPESNRGSDGSERGARTAKAAPKTKPSQPVKAETPPPPKPAATPPPTTAKKEEEKPKDEKKKRGFFGNLKKKIGDIKPY